MESFLVPTFFVMNPVRFLPPDLDWKLCQLFFLAFCSASISAMRCFPLNALICRRLRSRVASSSPSMIISFFGISFLTNRSASPSTRTRLGAGTPLYTSRAAAAAAAIGSRPAVSAPSSAPSAPSSAPLMSSASSSATVPYCVNVTLMDPLLSLTPSTTASYQTLSNLALHLDPMRDANTAAASSSAARLPGGGAGRASSASPPPASFTRSSVSSMTSWREALTSRNSAFVGSALRSSSTSAKEALCSSRLATNSSRLCGASSAIVPVELWLPNCGTSDLTETFSHIGPTPHTRALAREDDARRDRPPRTSDDRFGDTMPPRVRLRRRRIHPRRVDVEE